MINQYTIRITLATTLLSAWLLTGCKKEPNEPQLPPVEPELPLQKETYLYSSFNSESGPRVYQINDGNSIGNGLYYGTSGDAIIATVAGDVNDDGSDEFYSVLRTSQGCYIYKSEDSTLLGSAIYTPVNNTAIIKALAIGDLKNDGNNELFSAVNGEKGFKIYKCADGTSIGSISFTSHTGTVTAMTAGDACEDESDELFIAISNPKAAIYRSEDGASLGTMIYEDPNSSVYFTVAALAIGNIDKDEKGELFSAFNSVSGARIYRSEDGNSISGGGGAGIYYGNAGSIITAMTAGDVNEDEIDEVYTGITDSKAFIYRSEDGTSIGNSIYEDPNSFAYFVVASLTVRKY